MNAPQRTRGPGVFFAAFALVAVLVAGVVSYLTSADPDGLDAVTLQGCTGRGEQLSGECIAQNAEEHDLAGSPLAGYTVGGDEGLSGLSGVIGVLVTLVLAGGVFWLLRPRRSRRGPGAAPRPGPGSGSG
ncbi:MAG: PDGLE domain-containing protein [Actinomycetota bacterium]|nr:PDGLE domain-containing protein [Actinomycetota bacterium]